jgi:hypothetical protein
MEPLAGDLELIIDDVFDFTDTRDIITHDEIPSWEWNTKNCLAAPKILGAAD